MLVIEWRSFQRRWKDRPLRQ